MDASSGNQYNLRGKQKILSYCHVKDWDALSWQCSHSWHADYKELNVTLGKMMRVVQNLERLPLLLFTRTGNGLGC